MGVEMVPLTMTMCEGTGEAIQLPFFSLMTILGIHCNLQFFRAAG